jgi:DedD protein
MSAKNNDIATNPASTASAAAELELKRRGRRRLIGAITLGLIAIVVLPMIFDSAPRKVETGKQEIAITIPPKDGLPPLAPPAAAPTAAPAPAAPAIAPATPSASVANLPPTPAEVAAPKAAKVEAKPEAKPETKPETKAAPPPVTKAEPKAEPKPEAKPTAKADGGFVVQIGAYKEAANAKDVVARMKAAKLPVVTDTVAVKSGTVTRVRVGPYTDRAAAESALAAVKLAGEDGKVVPLK